MRQIARRRLVTKRVVEWLKQKRVRDEGEQSNSFIDFSLLHSLSFSFSLPSTRKKKEEEKTTSPCGWVVDGVGLGGLTVSGFLNSRRPFFLDLHSRRHQKSFSFPHWGIYTCAVLFFPLQLLFSILFSVVVFCVDPNYYDKPTGVVVLLLLY